MSKENCVLKSEVHKTTDFQEKLVNACLSAVSFTFFSRIFCGTCEKQGLGLQTPQPDKDFCLKCIVPMVSHIIKPPSSL